MSNIETNMPAGMRVFDDRSQTADDRLRGNGRPAGAFILAVALVAVYAVINVVFPLLPFDTALETYVLQPFLWLLVVLAVVLMPPYRTQAKLRIRNTFIWLGLGIALFQVVLYAIGGLFTGFGKNPASHTLTGIAETAFYMATMLLAVELSRAWLAARLGKRHSFIAVACLGVFFTFISIPTSQITGFTLEMQSTNIILSNWLPLLAENMLATMLVMLAGARASLAYRGLLAAFWWFCPVLPDLSWFFKALLGAGVPVMGMVTADTYYRMYSARLVARRKRESSALPISWIATALACVVIVWFAVGIFPFRPSVVGSGSMTPALHTGDMVVVVKVPAAQIKIGDIIEYRKDATTNIIHRVIDIDRSNGLAFITRGDANNTADENPVDPENVIGRVLFNVPKVGWVSNWIKGYF
jgi:signal peptidase I